MIDPPPRGADRRAALGSFIWQTSRRVHAAARRGNDSVVACRLNGGSMQPAIPARAWIRITFSPAPYHVGEVVAFMEGARVVAHRVVWTARARGDGLLITRGDARILPDAPVSASDVLGRVAEFDCGSGWQAPAMRSALPRRERCLAFALLAACAALLTFNAGLARRFVRWLDLTDLRSSWTKSLLY